jgi:hypothetical protein
MKKVPDGELRYGNIKSEGKILEIIPVLVSSNGNMSMLPPAYWHVENWILGFDDEHYMACPAVYWGSETIWINGSNAARPMGLRYMARVVEDGRLPVGSSVSHIDAEAMREMIKAIKGENQNDGDGR